MRWETKKALRRELAKAKVIARHVAEQLEKEIERNSLLEAEVSMLREEYQMKTKMLADLKESLILSDRAGQNCSSSSINWRSRRSRNRNG